MEIDHYGNLYILEYTSSFNPVTGFQLNSGRILRLEHVVSFEVILEGIISPRDMVDRQKWNDLCFLLDRNSSKLKQERD